MCDRHHHAGYDGSRSVFDSSKNLCRLAALREEATSKSTAENTDFDVSAKHNVLLRWEHPIILTTTPQTVLKALAPRKSPAEPPSTPLIPTETEKYSCRLLFLSPA